MCRSSSLFSFFLHVYRAKKYIEHHVFLQTSLHSEVQIFTQLEFACAFLLLLTEELYRVHIPFLLSLCMPCRGSESTRLLLQFASNFIMGGVHTLCSIRGHIGLRVLRAKLVCSCTGKVTQSVRTCQLYKLFHAFCSLCLHRHLQVLPFHVMPLAMHRFVKFWHEDEVLPTMGVHGICRGEDNPSLRFPPLISAR